MFFCREALSLSDGSLASPKATVFLPTFHNDGSNVEILQTPMVTTIGIETDI